MQEDKIANIYYFVDDKGNSPVKNFIKSLSLKERAKVFAYIAELKKQGHNLRRPLADYLRDDIYELRPKRNRIFYLFFLKDNVVLIHAIKKKADRISDKDIQLCIKRKIQIEEYVGLEKLEL